jgi:photosystem II stability/assembly factor-like uncharacterized protein
MRKFVVAFDLPKRIVAMRCRVTIVFFLISLLSASVQLLGAPDVEYLGPEGGDVRSLAYHPEVPERVFLGTADGQVYVSNDWGRRWVRLKPGIGRRELVLDALVVNPADPDELWVGGWELRSDRGALYRSRDGGATFERIELGIFDSSLRAIAVSPADPRRIAVGVNEGVLLSRDGGRTWERITRGYRSLYNVHSLAFDPRHPDTLYVGTFRLGSKTENLGEKWVPIHNGMFWDSDLFSFQVHPDDPDVLLVGACSGVYRSLNGGEQWTRLRNGIPDAAKRTRVVRFDPVNPNRWYAGTTEGLFRSEDRGESWRCILPDVVINAIAVHPGDNRRILVGTEDAGILTSEDDGGTFTPSNRGFAQHQVSAVASRKEPSTGGQVLYAAVAAASGLGGFYYCREHTELSWHLFSEGLEPGISIRMILPSEQGQDVLLGTSRGVFLGQPGRTAWKRLAGTERLEVFDLAWATPDSGEVLIASRQGLFRYLLRSGGLKKVAFPVYDRQVFCIARVSEGGKWFAGTEMGVFRADESEGAWKLAVEGLPYVAVRDLLPVGGRLVAATDEGLFYSDDLAEHWRKVTTVFPLEVSVLSASDDLKLIAAEPVAGYLFVSLDRAESWQAVPMNSAVSRITSLAPWNGREFVAGTVSEGVVRLLWPEAEVTAAVRSGPHETR